MNANDWKFQSMNFYNMGNKMSGNVTIQHNVTSSKIEMTLLPEDLVKIFEVLEDRIVESFASASRAFFLQAGMPVKAFQPPHDPVHEIQAGEGSTPVPETEGE